MSQIRLSYHRPEYTHPVNRRKDVGLTGEGDSYACEAWDGPTPGDIVGYGSGDSPEAARRSACADFHRKAKAFMRGER